MEERAKFVYLFTTSNTEPDVDPIVFVIAPAVKNSIVWSAFIVYIEALQVTISKIYYISSTEYRFVLANSADSDEMPPYAAFHLSLYCLSQYRLGVSAIKGLNTYMNTI